MVPRGWGLVSSGYRKLGGLTAGVIIQILTETEPLPNLPGVGWPTEPRK
jgi:hypothetical protein